MMDFNPTVRRTAAFGQLEEHADLAIEQGKRWLFQRADGTYQADERYAAWIVWVGLHVLTEDEIAKRRMHLAPPVTLKTRLPGGLASERSLIPGSQAKGEIGPTKADAPPLQFPVGLI
jgi:hypothetical protein